ncbi:AraC family transcriptional regulator [Leptobacterium flavescens]|uniref:AraC family transcriptional regulator n=1 Tax=Leptobacterium flavescens TaxID=472055 RepID=A0A6P0UPA4_9FLAO|nr:AraC family transcriptional regulator [Leptobacterium flavescens]NER14322.1 AraC family transcriptional regulator [Leptobacterium flavescens]
MIYKVWQPDLPLSDYIKEMVYHKGHRPSHTKDRFLPDGTLNLVVDLQDEPKYIYDNLNLEEKQKCERAWFSGMHTEYLTISSGIDAEMMVVTFKAEGSFPFVNTPLHEFSNKVVDAELVFGEDILSLREELKSESKPEVKFKRMEEWLLSARKEVVFSGDVIPQLVQQIRETPSEVNLKDIAERSGYSQKQFIHLFKKYVGLSPKQYHRIVRFNEILEMIYGEKQIEWAMVAASCGYFDQAHFIRDFQAFSGLNPKKYITDQGDYRNYVPLK